MPLGSRFSHVAGRRYLRLSIRALAGHVAGDDGNDRVGLLVFVDMRWMLLQRAWATRQSMVRTIVTDVL
jgi:hypothetical protein